MTNRCDYCCGDLGLGSESCAFCGQIVSEEGPIPDLVPSTDESTVEFSAPVIRKSSFHITWNKDGVEFGFIVGTGFLVLIGLVLIFTGISGAPTRKEELFFGIICVLCSPFGGILGGCFFGYSALVLQWLHHQGLKRIKSFPKIEDAVKKLYADSSLTRRIQSSSSQEIISPAPLLRTTAEEGPNYPGENP